MVCALENFREVNPAKAALRIEGRFPAPGDYRIHLCDQCGVCAEVCPVEAIELKGDAYIIDPAECTACMQCVEECPHDVLLNTADERADQMHPLRRVCACLSP